MFKKTQFILLLIGLYLVTAGSSYAVFKIGSSPAKFKTPQPTTTGAPVDPRIPVLTGPKNQECPMNGALYTQTEKDLWNGRRPLLVMIENSVDSRPQSGLSKADVVYEALAEGGVTRFMAVFYCGNAAYALAGDYDVGPVRSARTYFVDWASEYADYPLYAHVGGSNCSAVVSGGACTTDKRVQALEQIASYGWLNKETRSDMNQFALGFKVCRREPDRLGHEVATEHSMYCSTEALLSTAKDRGLTNVNYLGVSWDKNFRPWKFKNDSPSDGSVSPEMTFWNGYPNYDVKWVYEKATNSYKRFNAGQPFIDFNNNQQLDAKNVVVQYAQEKGPLDEHKHLLYTTIADGEKALIFQDGKVIEGRWSKKSRTGRTIFYNQSGEEIKFNRGLIWIEVLPLTAKVTY